MYSEDLLILDEFYFRRPVVSINEFKKIFLTNRPERLNLLLENKRIYEAIYLSSPSTIEAYKRGDENEKLSQTLFKFYSRSCFRASPYGLFSGVGKGKILDTSPVIYCSNKVRKNISLSFSWMYNYVLQIQQKEIEKIKLKSNMLIRQSGEYYILPNADEKSSIKTIKITRILEEIIVLARDEIETKHIIDHLQKKFDVAKKDVITFLKRLLEEKILISSLSAESPLKSYFKQIKEQSKILSFEDYNDMVHIDSLLSQYSNSTIGDSQKLVELQEVLLQKDDSTKNNVVVDLKYEDEEYLSKDVKEEIRHIYYLLQSFSTPSVFLNSTKNIRDYFLLNYNIGDEIPLLEFLYSEMSLKNLSLDLPNLTDNNIVIQKSKLLDFYIEEAILEGKRTINLTKKDLNKFSSIYVDEKKSSLTSIVTTVIREKNKNMYILNRFLTGSSTVDLMGRFFYLFEDKNLLETYANIVTDSSILAEISSFSPKLDFNNVGNSVKITNHELCINTRNNNVDIDISDIDVCMDNDTIYLKNRRTNKQVVPVIHSMQNMVYFTRVEKFLFLFSKREDRVVESLLDNELSERIYCPRVMYENIIVFRAQYKVSFLILKLDDTCSFIEFKHALELWRNRLNIPEIMGIEKNGETQYFLLNYDISLKMLFKILKKEKNINLVELGFDINEIDCKDQYLSEYIFSVYNGIGVNKKNDIIRTNRIASIPRKNEKTFYIKFYIQEDLIDVFLSTFIYELKNKYLNNKIFIVRYWDPEFHIRFRVLDISYEMQASLYSFILEMISKKEHPVEILKYQIEAFIPEVNRYGGEDLSKVIYDYFSIETDVYLNIVKKSSNKEISQEQYLQYLFNILVLITNSFYSDNSKAINILIKGIRLKNSQRLSQLFEDIFLGNSLILDDFSGKKKMGSILNQISIACENEIRDDIFLSIVHMTINRFNFGTNITEDDIYYLLQKHLKRELYQLN